MIPQVLLRFRAGLTPSIPTPSRQGRQNSRGSKGRPRGQGQGAGRQKRVFLARSRPAVPESCPLAKRPPRGLSIESRYLRGSKAQLWLAGGVAEPLAAQIGLYSTTLYRLHPLFGPVV